MMAEKAILVRIKDLENGRSEITSQLLNVQAVLNDKDGVNLVPIKESKDNIVMMMAMLCEGIIQLMHIAETEGVKPSAESMKDIVHHIEQGFVDSSYEITKFSKDEDF